jgi:iron complex outermembrane recepter protein
LSPFIRLFCHLSFCPFNLACRSTLAFGGFVKLRQLAHAISLACIAGPLWAQQTPPTPAPATPPQQPAKVERVEVTGTNIRRVDAEGSLPVQVITRAEIEREGITSAEQLLAILSVNGNGLDNLASNADVVDGAQRGNNGASSANLRGQGNSATLVLLNGRRVAAHGLNGGVVDLNSIPFAAVERVEVLKDGASAIYGTDAVGGVINFILRKNFRGASVNAFMDTPQEEGGKISRFAVAGGFGDLETQRFNVLGSFAYSENKALRGSDRSFINTFQPDRGLSVDTRGTPYATIFNVFTRNALLNAPFVPGSTTTRINGVNTLDLPGNPGCGSIDGQAPYDERLWATPSALFGCAWDTGRAAVLQQPVENTNVVLRGTLKVTDTLTAFAEFTGAKVESAKSFSPYQLSSSTANTSVMFNVGYPSNGSAYNRVFNALVAAFPTLEANRGTPIAYRWRCMACGNREIETTSETARFVAGLEGEFRGWEWRAAYSRATSETKSTLGSGYYFNDLLRIPLLSGELNPFLLAGESQTAAAMQQLQAASAKGVTLYGGEFTLSQADASISGPVMKLPAGELQMAVGVDFREEEFKFNGDERDLANQRAIFLAPFDNVNALSGVSRKIKAAYAEALIPITKQLEASVAVRTDDYTGFGRTTNPKVTFRFVPTKQLLFRGSYNTGFRVPTFNQLFNGITESPYVGKDLVDPFKCPSLVVSVTPGCESITPNTLFGGRPNLGPEEAKQYSVGVVFAPLPSLSMNVDWWSIEREGTIQSLPLQTIVANYTLFPGSFIRDAAGNVVQIDTRWLNAGETVTKGVELGAKWNSKLGPGRLTASIDGTYLLEKKSKLVASQPFGTSEIGRFTRSGDLGIRWKHFASVTYSQGPWSGTFSQRFSLGYIDAVLPGVANGTVNPPNFKSKTDDYIVYNVSASYRGIKNLTLTAGVKNILDTDPPFSSAYDSNTGAGSSWEPRVGDPRGRAFTLSATYNF